MKRLLLSLIGIGIFVAILTQVDITATLSSVANAKWGYVALAVAMTLPLILLKVWRWKILLDMQGIEYGFRQAIPAYFSSTFIGLVTPGRVGDFTRVLYLSRDTGVPKGKAFSSVLVDRLFDLHALVMAGTAGLVTLVAGGLAMIAAPFAFMGTYFLIPMLLLRSKRPVVWLLKKFEGVTEEFYEGVRTLSEPRLVKAGAVTMVAYFFLFAQYYIMTLALGISIGVLTLIGYVAIVGVVELIPVSIAGLGTRDATFIALFSLQGIGAEVALGYSLLVLFVCHLCLAVVGGVAWQLKPLRV